MTAGQGDESYLYIVRAEFGDRGREAAFNDWYDERHVPDLLTVPGFQTAQRYRDMAVPSRYLAAYDISGPEVFDHPRYAEVTGWREWESGIPRWSGKVYRHVMTKAAFGEGEPG